MIIQLLIIGPCHIYWVRTYVIPSCYFARDKVIVFQDFFWSFFPFFLFKIFVYLFFGGDQMHISPYLEYLEFSLFSQFCGNSGHQFLQTLSLEDSFVLTFLTLVCAFVSQTPTHCAVVRRLQLARCAHVLILVRGVVTGLAVSATVPVDE